MPQGLQVWDAAGNLTVDITDRLTRVLGIFDIGPTASGHIEHPAFATGDIWYFIFNATLVSSGYTPVITVDQPNGRIYYAPRTWFAGATVPTIRIIYGVY